MSNATDDPYLYPGTTVLRNRKGLRDPALLEQFEAASVLRRYLEARRAPLPTTFDIEHLKKLHRHLFQDVYPWAGEFRTTPLGKEDFVGGRITWFPPPQQIPTELDKIFQRLVEKNEWRGASRPELIHGLSDVLASLNHVHAYREGNGRVQRLFVEQLARAAGSELNFDVISRERMIQASIESERGDRGKLERLLTDLLEPERYRALREAVAFLEKIDQKKFDWNKAYVTFTVPGQYYAGVLFGRQGDSFMMRDEIRGHVVVGRQSEIPPTIRSGERLAFHASASPLSPAPERKRGRSR